MPKSVMHNRGWSGRRVSEGVPFSLYALPPQCFFVVCTCQTQRKERTHGKDRQKSALVVTQDTLFPTIMACRTVTRAVGKYSMIYVGAGGGG
jgi:hypothetical protein